MSEATIINRLGAGMTSQRPGGRNSFPAMAVVYSVVATFVVSLICVAFVSTTTDFLPGNTLWNGLSTFAGTYQAEVTENPVIAGLGPDVVLVTVPQLPYGVDELERLKSFVAGGGTLVITDDYGYGDQVLEYFGLSARFNGGTLLDPLFCYRNPSLPRVTDFAPEVTAVGVRAVVLNNATVIEGVWGGEVLARSSPQSYLELADGRRREGPFPVAAKVAYGQGSVILVADASIFINSMLALDDNRKFLDYLMSPAAEGRVVFDVSKVERELPDRARDMVTGMRETLGIPGVAASVLAVVFALSLLSFRGGRAFTAKNDGGDLDTD